MKTGTSWVHEYLVHHPSVCVPKTVKETYYFSDNYHKGISWYAKQYDDFNTSIALGEVSPTYFDEAEAATRIYEHSKDTKVVITIREPVSRFLSHFRHNVRAGIVPSDSNLEEVFKENRRMRGQSSYADNIKMWIKLFGADNTLVLFYEELEKNPQQFVNKVCRHLDIAELEVPEALNKRIGDGRNPVNIKLVRYIRKFVRFLRNKNLHFLVLLGKKFRVENVLYKKDSKEYYRYVGKNELIPHLTEDAIRLEREFCIDIQYWREIWSNSGERDSVQP